MNITEVYKRFPEHHDCLALLEKMRWGDSPVCPYCRSKRITSVPKEYRHHCNACNTSFSVLVGTIFHKTKLDLQKWFLAISALLKNEKGLSSRQLSKYIMVNKNTAWHLLILIKEAVAEDECLLKKIVNYMDSKKINN